MTFSKNSLVVLCLATMVGAPAFADQKTQTNPPPIAGATATVTGVTVDEMVTVARGWSAKKQILGKNVYNDKNEKIGKVEDVIVTPNDAVSFAIVGTGGFIGIDKHDVAVPVKELKLEHDRYVLAGATKESLRAMPRFEYAKQ